MFVIKLSIRLYGKMLMRDRNYWKKLMFVLWWVWVQRNGPSISFIGEYEEMEIDRTTNKVHF